jgi:carbon-monoxide dehydrogenase medium subunit
VKPAPFEYHAPGSLDETVELLARHGDEAKVLAGGQSLLPMLNFRLARPAVVVDINRIPGLDYVREEDGRVAIGALARQRRVERTDLPRLPLLGETLRWVGHAAIRTRGTIAGSLAHADPAAELPALLLCLDGSVIARSRAGQRELAAGRLFVAPLTTALRPDELITEVRVPTLPAGAGACLLEVARRHGDFALVGVVTVVELRGDRIQRARVALFGCAGTPVRATGVEQALRDQPPTAETIAAAARAATASLTPDSDLHASAEYRRRVAGTLVQRALATAAERARGRA